METSVGEIRELFECCMLLWKESTILLIMKTIVSSRDNIII